MSLLKCQKYLNKLSNTDVNDEKFGLYLQKLNYWYEQVGGKCAEKKSCVKTLLNKEKNTSLQCLDTEYVNKLSLNHDVDDYYKEKGFRPEDGKFNISSKNNIVQKVNNIDCEKANIS